MDWEVESPQLCGKGQNFRTWIIPCRAFSANFPTSGPRQECQSPRLSQILRQYVRNHPFVFKCKCHMVATGLQCLPGDKFSRLAQFVCYILMHLAKSGVVRSYLGYCAGSHQTSEAKRLWARIVLEWVTFREVLVTNPFLLLFCLAVHLFDKCAFSSCLSSFFEYIHHDYIALEEIWANEARLRKDVCMGEV